MSKDNTKNRIIMILLNQNGYVTADEIAIRLSLSARVIRYNISIINEEYHNSIISSPKGYAIINRNLFSELQGKSDIPTNYKERKTYILKKLLLKKDSSISLRELSDELCVTQATLNNELSRIRFEITPMNLKINTKNGFVFLNGTEKDIQKCLTSLITEEIGENFSNKSNINTFFNKVDIQKIEDIVLDVLSKRNYYIDNDSLMMVVIPLAVYIELNDLQNLNNDTNSTNQQNNAIHIQDIVKEIFSRLNDIYAFQYDETAIFEYSLVLLTRIVHEDLENISVADLEDHIDSKTKNLLYNILQKVKQNFSIDLYNQHFIVRFAFHLRNLLIRLKHNKPIPNKSFEDIKNNYPMMFSVAVYISYIIAQETGYEINEEEISYIALHIGVAIEENNSNEDKVKVILYSPNYFVTGQQIYSQLLQLYSDRIQIVGFVTTSFELNNKKDCDLILSTADYSNSEIPWLKISHFLTNNDLKNISDKIKDIKYEKQIKKKQNLLQFFFKKELFNCNLDNIKNDKDAIEFLCNQMETNGYVNSNFKDKIYERESISKSAYGRIAIPHPLDNDSESSSVAVLLSNKGIDWGGNVVNAIFLLSISNNDVEMFSNIFKIISHISSNNEEFRKLLSLDSYSSFINLIISKQDEQE